jgi:hypothetical protein
MFDVPDGKKDKILEEMIQHDKLKPMFSEDRKIILSNIFAWIYSKSCEIFATISSSFSLPPFLFLKSLISHHHDWF